MGTVSSRTGVRSQDKRLRPSEYVARNCPHLPTDENRTSDIAREKECLPGHRRGSEWPGALTGRRRKERSGDENLRGGVLLAGHDRGARGGRSRAACSERRRGTGPGSGPVPRVHPGAVRRDGLVPVPGSVLGHGPGSQREGRGPVRPDRRVDPDRVGGEPSGPGPADPGATDANKIRAAVAVIGLGLNGEGPGGRVGHVPGTLTEVPSRPSLAS
jgi:hypothetical protein